MTHEKDVILDINSLSEFKLLQLTDRGRLKYPSEPVLTSIVTLWKIFVSIEDNDKLLPMLVDCPSRKILVNLTLIYMSVIVMSGKRVVLTVTSVGRVSWCIINT